MIENGRPTTKQAQHVIVFSTSTVTPARTFQTHMRVWSDHKRGQYYHYLYLWMDIMVSKVAQAHHMGITAGVRLLVNHIPLISTLTDTGSCLSLHSCPFWPC